MGRHHAETSRRSQDSSGHNCLPPADRPFPGCAAVNGHPRHFQREISLDGSVHLRRAVEINIEAAVFKLALENRLYGTVDLGTSGWIPNTTNGWMKPQLHHDVIRFQGRIGAQVGP